LNKLKNKIKKMFGGAMDIFGGLAPLLICANGFHISELQNIQ